MASSREYVDYVIDQINIAGEIRCKSMFGEYGLYCNEKFFGSICDDRFIIKITPGGEALLPDCPRALPYEGGKEGFLIENFDDREFLREVIEVTCSELPEPKKKKKK